MNTPKNKEPLANSDKLPIEPHEEYRRAKRNSLWWSSITILTALSMSSDYNEKLGLINTNLKLEAWKILLTLSIVSFYMLFGYIKANRHLVFRHSQGLIRPSDSETGVAAQDALSMIENLKDDIRKASDSIPGAVAAANDYQHRIREASSELDAGIKNVGSRLEGMADAVSSQVQNLGTYPENITAVIDRISKGEKISEDEMERFISKIVTTFPNMSQIIASFQNDVREPVQDLRAILTSVEARLSKNDEGEFTLRKSQFDNNLEKLNSFEDNFRKIHKKILDEDKYWLMFYDKLPVWLLYIVSILALSYRVISY